VKVQPSSPEAGKVSAERRTLTCARPCWPTYKSAAVRTRSTASPVACNTP